MRTTSLILVGTLAGVVCLGSCAAERPVALDRQRNLLGPVPLKRQLAWVDSAL
ncbi:MAG: hypothetical protein H6Q90_4161, partial [Deltaproteobacteria bacterium]|nr:hypothetical protein [Deltaproteobacteria bacterium]